MTGIFTPWPAPGLLSILSVNSFGFYVDKPSHQKILYGYAGKTFVKESTLSDSPRGDVRKFYMKRPLVSRRKQAEAVESLVKETKWNRHLPSNKIILSSQTVKPFMVHLSSKYQNIQEFRNFVET